MGASAPNSSPECCREPFCAGEERVESRERATVEQKSALVGLLVGVPLSSIDVAVLFPSRGGDRRSPQDEGETITPTGHV